MVFIAASNVEGIDTMKGKLMLAWYRNARTTRALEQSETGNSNKVFQKNSTVFLKVLSE